MFDIWCYFKAFHGTCQAAFKNIMDKRDYDQRCQEKDFRMQKHDDVAASTRLMADEYTHKINTLASDNVNSAIDHSRGDFQSDLSNEYQQNMFSMGRDL